MLTPQPLAEKLAEKIGLKSPLYLKREDLHPYESHKGRSIPPMINHYAGSGYTNFCISSSGNAALAAIYAIEELNQKKSAPAFTLRVFVGKHIRPEKLNRLFQAIHTPNNIAIEQTDTPKQTAFQMDKNGLAKNLRQSTDDTALVGYDALANELAEIKNLAAIFVPTSSGAAAQGLYLGFKKRGLNPQIHIVQTSACHPMVKSNLPTEPSLATAIVDKIAYRKEKIKEIIKESDGKGWVATNDEIKKNQQLIKETENLDISANSALAVAGLNLALQDSWKFSGPVVCILTGK